MKHLSLIIVAGPAGGGKSTFAERLSRERDLPLVATDAFKHLAWEDVPFAAHEACMVFNEPGATCVVEGVRALSMVEKLGLFPRVTELYWVQVDGLPEKPNTKGMTTRQRNLLEAYGELLPNVVHVRGAWPADVEFRYISADDNGIPGTGIITKDKP